MQVSGEICSSLGRPMSGNRSCELVISASKIGVQSCVPVSPLSETPLKADPGTRSSNWLPVSISHSPSTRRFSSAAAKSSCQLSQPRHGCSMGVSTNPCFQSLKMASSWTPWAEGADIAHNVRFKTHATLRSFSVTSQFSPPTFFTCRSGFLSWTWRGFCLRAW